MSSMVIFLHGDEENTMVVLLPLSLQRASLVAFSHFGLALLEEVAKLSNICSCSKMLDNNDLSTILVTNIVAQTAICPQRAFF